jgi:hypothetical protein
MSDIISDGGMDPRTAYEAERRASAARPRKKRKPKPFKRPLYPRRYMQR